MAGKLLGSRLSWSGDVDEEGFKTYKVVFQVLADPLDGPGIVLATPGMPLPGALWFIGNETDPWVWCRWNRTARPIRTREPNELWEVECTFSSKPPRRNDSQRPFSQGAAPTDPLLEPPKISVSFSKDKEEVTRDLFGNFLQNSSFEQLRGALVTFQISRPTVRIEQNVLLHNLPVVASMASTVNMFPLWGLPRRCWLLHPVSEERKPHPTWGYFWTRTLEFEGRYDTWDRLLLDEGSKLLNGHWDTSFGQPTSGQWVLDDINGNPPDPKNPAHYKHFEDREGNKIRGILDGKGKPYSPAPQPTVTSCAQCPDGAPVTWIAKGWNEDDLSEALEMVYDGGCTWFSNTPGKPQLSLTYAPGTAGGTNYTWVLTHQDSGWEWGFVSETLEFDCNGINSLIPILNLIQGFTLPNLPSIAPTIIYPKPPTAIPGSRFVQYYRESDFAFLGIPLVF